METHLRTELVLEAINLSLWRGRPKDLKPSSSQTISLRLPKPMLDRLKLLANKRDVPYQSLLKMFVAERLKAGFLPHRRNR